MIRECKKHGNTDHYVRSRTTGNSKKIECKKCVASYHKERRNRNKKILVEEAGGKCSECGYNKSLHALHFHHIDKTNKIRGIAEFRNRSIDRMREEAKKCALLCANCHIEEHYGSID